MTVIARSFYHARRQATEWWGLIVVTAFALLLALGQFSAKRLWAGDLLVLTGLAIYAATMGRAILRELGPLAVMASEAPRRRGFKLNAVEVAHEMLRIQPSRRAGMAGSTSWERRQAAWTLIA